MSDEIVTENESSGKAIAVRREALAGFSLTPRSLQEAMELAKLMADSDLVPKDFRGKPGNVLIAVQMGAEVGLSPMAAIQNIAVVNGRPSLWGDAGRALLLAAGCDLDEADAEEIRKTGTARCTIRRPGRTPVTRTFSMDDAKRAALLGKDTYRNYPERMIAWRAFWFAARDAASDILRGLAGAEELQDYPEPHNITPHATEAEMMPRAKGAERVEAEPQGPDPASHVEFELGGKTYRTAGITREQMLETFRLAPEVDKRHGKNTAAKVLREDFSAESRKDLTEEQAGEYIAKLELAVSLDARD